MINLFIKVVFKSVQFAVIADKTMVVQLLAGQLDCNNVIVTVQPGARMILGQPEQLVRGGEGELLGYAIH